MYAELLILLAYCCLIGCLIAPFLDADEVRQASESGVVDVNKRSV